MRWRNSSSATRADDESETWRYGIVSKVQSHGEIAFSRTAAVAAAPFFSRRTRRPCSTALWRGTKSEKNLKRSRSASAPILNSLRCGRRRLDRVSFFSFHLNPAQAALFVRRLQGRTSPFSNLSNHRRAVKFPVADWFRYCRGQSPKRVNPHKSAPKLKKWPNTPISPKERTHTSFWTCKVRLSKQCSNSLLFLYYHLTENLQPPRIITTHLMRIYRAIEDV